MALMEAGEFAEPSGRIVNANVGTITCRCTRTSRRSTSKCSTKRTCLRIPLGAKGIGEIGITAALCNAVHDATGRRIRSLPLTPDELI